ncbi:MAG: hypothetical protein U0136_16225 [Bdellovibrionota bacterium]
MIQLSETGEEFEVWKPLPNLSGEFELLEIRDSENGLLVTLESESGRSLGIHLHEPIAYRVTALGLNAYWNTFESQAAAFGVFWQALRSQWIETLEPDPAAGPIELSHFLVLTSESAIEILAAEPPHVSWFDNFFGDAT